MARRLRELALWAGALLGLGAVVVGVAVMFFGFSFLVFRSGSMSPEIPTGGLALSRTVQADDIRSGDVVSVIASSGDRITHRVVTSTVRGDTASLVLKGDANATEDPEVYQVTSVERVVASVPYGGYVVARALTPPGLVAATALSLMLLVLGFGSPAAPVDPAAPAAPAAPRPGPRVRGREARHRGRVSRRVRVSLVLGLVGVTAAVGAVGAGIGGVVPTLARFTDQATVRTGSFAAARFFTCDAAVRGVASPYLYWELDDTVGPLASTAADSSGNGRPGTYQGIGGVASTTSKACARDTGAAVTLSTPAGLGITSGWVSTQGNAGSAVSGNAAFTTFSATIWFRTSTTTGGKLFGFGNSQTGVSGNYDRHVYMTNAGRLVFGVYPGAVREVASPAATPYNDNAWHQVVATLSSSGMRLYVDGALVDSRTDTTTAQDYSGWWRVGYDNLDAWGSTPTSRAFSGTVDEFAVYSNTALTAADVAAMYRAGR